MRFVFSDSSNVVRIVLIAILSIAVIPVSAALKEVADEDTRYRSAEELLEMNLRRDNIEIGYDARAERCVILKSEQISLDPASDSSFIEKRTQLERQLLLDCRCEVAELMCANYIRSDLESAPSRGKSTTTLSMAVKQPVSGLQILRQAESFDGKVYQMAVVAVWSKKLERSARAIMGGSVERVAATNVKFRDWVSEIDLSSPCVTRFVYDDTGVFHAIGVGVCALDGDAAHDRIAEEIARDRARLSIQYSLFADCEQAQECKTVRKSDASNLCTLRSEVTQKAQETCDMTLSGIVEVKSGVATYPITGQKVFVSICEINAANVAVWRDRVEQMYTDGIKAATDLSSVLVKSRIQGSYTGKASFTSRQSSADGFAECLKKAFLQAYVQSVDKVLQGATTQTKEVFSVESKYGDRDSKKVNALKDGSKAVCAGTIEENKTGWIVKDTVTRDCELKKDAALISRGELSRSKRMPLLGAMNISQKDYYDLKTGVYSVCVDLTGAGPKKGAMDIDECIAHTDFKKMIGPRQYRDKNGDVWLLGVGMADADADDAKQKSARNALLFLGVAAGVEFSSQIEMRECLERNADDSSTVAQKVDMQKTITRIENVWRKLSRAKRRKFAGEDVHPLTGKKIYTTVYIVNTKGL